MGQIPASFNANSQKIMALNSSLNFSGYVIVIQPYAEIFHYLCFVPFSLSSAPPNDR